MTSLSIETAFYFVVFTFAGAVLGSFSSAIIHRIKQGESWIVSGGNKAARSQCPKCGHVLGFMDLVPVISWLWQKGCCRYCYKKISRQYLFLELVSILLALVVYYLFGFSQISLFLLCLLPFTQAQLILFFRGNVISTQLCGIIGGIILFYSIMTILI